MPLLACLTLFFASALVDGCNGSETWINPAPLSLDKIFAPVKVGVPPENAFHGLVRLPDGVLRHYGYRGPQRAPSEHIYIFSRDNGLTWDNDGVVLSGDASTDESGPPPAQNPGTGSWIRVASKRDGTWAMRGGQGIDGPYEKVKVDSGHYIMIRQPLFLKSRKRILVTGHRSWQEGNIASFQTCVLYSDDDGRSWKVSKVPMGPRHRAEPPHAKTRWENNALEATVAELGDGRLWMLLRTSQDYLYESFSSDGGETWSKPEQSRFFSTLTMPTLFRISDGRLLLLWCNTTPLPEVDRTGDLTIRPEQRTGLWEDVFTNRDAIHAAISSDDGKSWRGFRELYLNPLRNEPDFATSGGNITSLDKSVHQSQAVELPGGKVLVAFGQHPLVRSMVIFDPDWLLQTTRADSLANGLEAWSTHKYVEGIKGHCAYNRNPGSSLVDHPDKPGRRALHVRRPLDKSLVCDIDGAVWNFPAGYAGNLTVRIKLAPDGQGGRLALLDRWFNPTDTLACRQAMYCIEFDGGGRTNAGQALEPGRWHELRLEWDDCRTAECRLYVDGQPSPQNLALLMPGPNGISYVHIQSASSGKDLAGFLVESVLAAVEP